MAACYRTAAAVIIASVFTVMPSPSRSVLTLAYRTDHRKRDGDDPQHMRARRTPASVPTKALSRRQFIGKFVFPAPAADRRETLAAGL